MLPKTGKKYKFLESLAFTKTVQFKPIKLRSLSNYTPQYFENTTFYLYWFVQSHQSYYFPKFLHLTESRRLVALGQDCLLRARSWLAWPENDITFWTRNQAGCMISGQRIWVFRNKLLVHPDLGYRLWPHHDITGLVAVPINWWLWLNWPDIVGEEDLHQSYSSCWGLISSEVAKKGLS